MRSLCLLLLMASTVEAQCYNGQCPVPFQRTPIAPRPYIDPVLSAEEDTYALTVRTSQSANGIIGLGTCAPIFQFEKRVYCVTVAHVLGDCDSVTVDGRPARVEFAEITREVAMLSFEPIRTVYCIKTARQDAASNGGCVYSPPGNKWRRKSCGAVKGDEIYVPIVQGQSGSPVISQAGFCLGLINYGGNGSGKFIPWSRFREALVRYNCIPAESPADKPIPDPAVSQRPGNNADVIARFERLEQMIASIEGKPGPKGDKGDQGEPGPKGDSIPPEMLSDIQRRLADLERGQQALAIRPYELHKADGTVQRVELKPGDAIKIYEKVKVTPQ